MTPSYDELPGRAASLWLETVNGRVRAPLQGDRRADVAVVGAGMVGLTAAKLLADEGADVVVLEAGRIGQGATGRTTAKLSSLQGLTYASLERSRGAEVAQAYAEANEEGLRIVAGLIERDAIDCDFRRKPNFTFTLDQARRADLEEEAAAAQRAGLRAELTAETDLPFAVEAAVRVPEQAEFHPLRYLHGLADQLETGSGSVFEGTRVTGAGRGQVRTEGGGQVTAESVVLATHLPILDRGGQFALVEPERSHAIATRLEGPVPQGMYLSAESPSISMRSHPVDGEELLIVGGRSARMGTGDPSQDFAELARFARERFEVRDFECRWSAHDYMPVDGVPLVGPLLPGTGGIWFATGFRKWGLAMGAAAARFIADAVLGRENALAEPFNPWRLPNPRAMLELGKNGIVTGIHLLGDRVRRDGGTPDLEPGEGAIVDSGLGKHAVYVDESGTPHALSARCSHLGCIVAWNRAERTWDCPCHGSRFAATGEVIDGPATSPLPPA